MKMYKLWWPLWLLFVGFWALVFWPVAIIMLFIKIVADKYFYEWAGTMLMILGAGSAVVAVLTFMECLKVKPLDIVTCVAMVVFAVMSTYVVLVGWNRNVIGQNFRKYAKSINERITLSLYDLSNDVKENSMDKVAETVELMIKTNRMPFYFYDRDNMIIDCTKKNPTENIANQRQITFKCKRCGAPNQVVTSEAEAVCEYCDTAQNS